MNATTEVPQKRDMKVPILGILFIVLGSALLLDRLDVMSLRWGRVFWALVTVFGGVLVVLAFVNRIRRNLMWGNLFLFFGGVVALYQWHVIPREDFYFLPMMSIAFGLSFLMTFLYEPRNLPLLIPAIVFVGFGVVFYLWWWEYLDWFDFRYYARTYWPVLLIALGAAIALRRRTS